VLEYCVRCEESRREDGKESGHYSIVAARRRHGTDRVLERVPAARLALGMPGNAREYPALSTKCVLRPLRFRL
jgi:hypothetical protein